MANRFAPPPRPKRPGESQEIRSQVALEILLNAYAIGGALVVFRALLKSLEVDRELWVGGAIYGITNLIARPMILIPGADKTIVGDLTLVDATLLAGVVLFPLGLLVYGNRKKNLARH
jgi:hypothetical protein